MAETRASTVRPGRAPILALAVLSVFLISGGPTAWPIQQAPDGLSAGAAGSAAGLEASTLAASLSGSAGATALRAGSAAAPEEDVLAADLVERTLASVRASLSPRDRARITAAILRYSRQYDLEPDLVIAIMLVESDARPWAHSPSGAVGLMQVMPHMMQPLRLAGNAATIESNIEAGCFILANNIRRLGVEDGISAYFWGSQIRGVAYLEKVLEARERVRGLRTS